jgi:hypothetical protein
MIAPLHAPPPFRRSYSVLMADMRQHFDRATIDRPDTLALSRTRATEGMCCPDATGVPDEVDEGQPDGISRCAFCGHDCASLNARGLCGECR